MLTIILLWFAYVIDAPWIIYTLIGLRAMCRISAALVNLSLQLVKKK